MSFTRISSDRDRINKNLEEDFRNLKYMTNVPGNGTKPYFIVDPQIRLQGFGANISHNMADINSSLIGLNRNLCRDNVIPNNGRSGNSEPFNDKLKMMSFPTINNAITDQPRMTNPAWTLRDLETTRWNYLHSDPQKNFEKRFSNNLSSRILEIDNFDAKNC